jgi:AcrR family transcriptional regulator
MVSAMNERLSKADWLNEGLRTLSLEGVGGLKVGPMADRLKVSRGSFYWHFTDVGDLRSQLLGHWSEQATEEVIRRMEGRPAPDRLKALLRLAFVEDRRLERAIRAWAATDPQVAETVASVDARRVDVIARFLRENDVARGPATIRARFVYWAWLGQTLVMDPDVAGADPAQIDGIIDLLTGS